MTKTEDFINNLRTEIQNTQIQRAKLVSQKFTFVIGLLGIGSLSIGNVHTQFLLFITPIIAFTFDLYITGFDFGVRRVGGFLGRKSSEACDEEKNWERFVRKNRDTFVKIGGPLLSILVLVASIIVLWSDYNNVWYFWLWMAVDFLMLIWVWYYSYRLNKIIENIREENE
ncbi:MAG: hypothetical protein HY800_00240 [Ignavibacteriales bacterium]|nr:hypothetical protein [Ignavibacteriales bacterium]